MSKEDDSEVGNYFHTNFLDLQNSISPQDRKKFMSLDSDSERIGFLMSYPEMHAIPIETVAQMQKNGEKALKLKDAGNKLFGRGEFVEALEMYSNAVLLAPREGN